MRRKAKGKEGMKRRREKARGEMRRWEGGVGDKIKSHNFEMGRGRAGGGGGGGGQEGTDLV